jgi:hypothetical protein
VQELRLRRVRIKKGMVRMVFSFFRPHVRRKERKMGFISSNEACFLEVEDGKARAIRPGY